MSTWDFSAKRVGRTFQPGMNMNVTSTGSVHVEKVIFCALAVDNGSQFLNKSV